jgi:hypothetical protein
MTTPAQAFVSIRLACRFRAERINVGEGPAVLHPDALRDYQSQRAEHGAAICDKQSKNRFRPVSNLSRPDSRRGNVDDRCGPVDVRKTATMHSLDCNPLAPQLPSARNGFSRSVRRENDLAGGSRAERQPSSTERQFRSVSIILRRTG